MKAGDQLFEHTLAVNHKRRLERCTREWEVLSVTCDPMYLSEKDEPLRVVTMRSFYKDRALYKAELEVIIRMWCDSGSWSRIGGRA